MSIGRNYYKCPADRCQSSTDTKRGLRIHAGVIHVPSDFPGGEVPDWDDYFSELE